MSTETSSPTRDAGHLVSRTLRAPMRRQTYRNLLYLLTRFPLGVGYFVFLSVGFSAGVPLLAVGVGALVLLATLAVCVQLTRFERALLRRLLGVDVPEPDPVTDGGVLNRTRRFVTDRRTWGAAVYLLSVFVFMNVVLSALASLVATAASFLLAPLYYRSAPVTAHAFGPVPSREFTLDLLFGWDNLLVGLTTTVEVGSLQIQTLPGALAVAVLGAALLVIALQTMNVVAWAWSRYARVMLTAPRYWTTPW